MFNKNKDFLHQQILKKNSFLCVGLDPDITKIPNQYLHQTLPIFEFCKDIIEATNEFAIAYKLNIAFFESQGLNGWLQLEKTITLIPQDCLIILDAKRADIGNTSKQYADYYFEKLKVDAVTLHPYMGLDSLEPFLHHKNKWSVVLALTSNPGSVDFEMQNLANGHKLYQEVINKFIQSAYSEQLMFVVGATHPESFKEIRQICPDHFLLVPGIGEQGGDLQKTIEYGKNNWGGLLINVSRNIIFPKIQTGDFIHDVKSSAKEYVDQMKTHFS